jgi:hypothetical protein
MGSTITQELLLFRGHGWFNSKMQHTLLMREAPTEFAKIVSTL